MQAEAARSGGVGGLGRVPLEADRAPMHYRPDIDGLRAVAVLAVLFFHCFPEVVPGGFVGVDVFFVISGYLIGRSSLIEIAAGNYSVAAYFARRARRLFPALVTVLLAVWVLGWWILLPSEFRMLGKHVAGASVFISNWQFWREIGYFDTDAALKPLLHLWSLAVEEQFYLLFPLMLIGTLRRRKSPLLPLAIVAGISFLAAWVRLADHKAWTYFNLLSRGWELLIGVAVAYGEIRGRFLPMAKPDRSLVPPRLRAAAGFVGLAAIALATFGYSGHTPFPGPAALLPTVGAALVIAGGTAATRHALGWRPLVYLGLISYPLYLWHWPLLALARTVDGLSLDVQTRLGIFLLSFPLASLTYHFVERPLRFARFSRRRFFPVVLWAALLATGGLGLSSMVSQGFPNRFPDLDAIERPASPAQVMPERGYSSASRAILLGDSHAMMYADALRSYFFRQHGQALVDASRGGCKPFADLDKHRPGEPPQGCPALGVNAGIEQAVSDPSIDTVVLVSALVSFNYYIYPGFAGPPNGDTAYNEKIMDRAIDDTIQRLAGSGKRVILFYTTPMLDFPPTTCQRRPFRVRSEAREPCAVERRHYDEGQAWSRHKLTSLAARYPNVVLFDPAPSLCDEASCRGRADGKLLYVDPIHLNRLGAEIVSRRFAF